MGDRVIMQVVKHDKFSPVAYGHWSGDQTPRMIARLRQRMLERPGDAEYTFARLIQEMTKDDNGALSFGAWNADRIQNKDDSHGDAGVVLIDVSQNPLQCVCMGGYLEGKQI